MRAATESTTHILPLSVITCQKSCGCVSVVCWTGGLMRAATEPRTHFNSWMLSQMAVACCTSVGVV